MPRRPRIHLDGVPLRIVQRVHNRQPCFYAVADYLACMRYIELNPVRAAMSIQRAATVAIKREAACARSTRAGG